jgi:hypothetical protein
LTVQCIISDKPPKSLHPQGFAGCKPHLLLSLSASQKPESFDSADTLSKGDF